MTSAMRRYEIAEVRHRVARAMLLRQIARDPDRLAELLAFARTLGDDTAADTLGAFVAAQDDALRAAQAELDRLTD